MLLTILSLTGLTLLLAYVAVIHRCLSAWNALSEWKLPCELAPQTYISVLVLARDEASHIGRLLDTLARQHYPQEKFEVIVIDDHSTDGTAERVEQYPFGNLRLLRLAEHLGPGKHILSYKKEALELGIKQAKGTLILTTDADCEAPPYWLASHAAFYEATGLTLIGILVVLIAVQRRLDDIVMTLLPLGIAALCVAGSRAIAFVPGYVYGVVAEFHGAELSDEDEGRYELDVTATTSRGAVGRFGVATMKGPTTAATPAMPVALGCTGAAWSSRGMMPSTQRTPLSWQASWPMPGVYTST